MLNVSSISGSATSAELSSLTYDHFFRTVPSDTFLAKAMVDLVTHFNWSYVAVVALYDSYGAWAVVSESTSKKKLVLYCFDGVCTPRKSASEYSKLS